MTIEETTAKELIAANPESALRLALALMGEMCLATFPEVGVATLIDDGEEYEALQCPHCEGHLNDEDITVVDWGTYETQSGDTSPEGIAFYYDHEPEMHTLHYQCNRCARPISIPKNIPING